MADYEELLEEKTWKNQVGSVYERICYTISARIGETAFSPPTSSAETPADSKAIQHRQTVVLAKLIEHLNETGVVDDDALDRILFQATR